jgi:hypothetical protein
MQVGDKRACGRELRVKSADCGGTGIGGTVKNHKSEEGDFEPVRKRRVEEAESNAETEEGVKMAKPLLVGRRRGDRPTRECERAKSCKT